MTIKILSKPKDQSGNEEHWVPLSDLMSGLMMIFMLIAVMYIVKHNEITEVQYCEAKVLRDSVEAVRRLTEVYEKTQKELRDSLYSKLKTDLPKWGAELGNDLAVKFNDPKILFATARSDLTPRFKSILSTFIPKYLEILYDSKYRSLIKEIRIEGHTSSIWNNETTARDAYLKNMALSQARTLSTLAYVLDIDRDEKKQNWLVSLLTANGLSSSKAILDSRGKEDYAKSRRVEFRIRTNAEARLLEIINATDFDLNSKLKKCRSSGQSTVE